MGRRTLPRTEDSSVSPPISLKFFSRAYPAQARKCLFFLYLHTAALAATSDNAQSVNLGRPISRRLSPGQTWLSNQKLPDWTERRQRQGLTEGFINLHPCRIAVELCEWQKSFLRHEIIRRRQ